MISDYLLSCGLSEKEIQIFLKVFQYGPKTATQISHISNIERTNCYKIIDKLCKEGLIQTSEKNGIKQFRVEKNDCIKHYLERKKEKIDILKQGYDTIEFEFQKLRSKPESSFPKIQLYEQQHGIVSLYKSILESCKKQGCSVIQVFTSNSLTSSGIIDSKTHLQAKEFYQQLESHSIHVEQRTGMGIEQISYHANYEGLQDLHHGSGSTQIRVIGKQLYMILFKDIPIGIKIESPELSYMIYALLVKG